MTDAAIEDNELSRPLSKEDRQQLAGLALSTGLLVICSLLLIWPYGFTPLLATLTVTAIAFALFAVIFTDSFRTTLSKSLAAQAGVISGAFGVPLVLLYTLTSKWGELFTWWLGVSVGIIAVLAGLVVIWLIGVFIDYGQERRSLQLYIGLWSFVLVLLGVTASFTPSGVLQFKDGGVTYTTTPSFNVPWVHEQPMERPALWGEVTIAPKEPAGWRAEIRYSVPDPFVLLSDDWKQYRALQSGSYVYPAFNDTENPAEALQHGFLTRYPFLRAKTKVTHTVATVWEAGSLE